MTTDMVILAAKHILNILAHQAGHLVHLEVAPANEIAAQARLMATKGNGQHTSTDLDRIEKTVNGIVKMDRVHRRKTAWSNESGQWIKETSLGHLFGLEA